MKYPVTLFKNLTLALKELERFIRDDRVIQSGEPLGKFGGMLPREAIANWLLCAAANSRLGPDRMTFCSDPTGGDGIIYDRKEKHTWLTEHVVVPSIIGGVGVDIETRILKAIEQKNSKGPTYASGKTLVVFQTAQGENCYPNRVAKQLPDPLYFADVYVVGLRFVEDGSYVYQVTNLDISAGNAPVLLVRLSKDFDSWTVEPIQ